MEAVTRPAPFSDKQEEWYRAACARIDERRLQRLLIALVNVHSPTGREREASEFLAGYLCEHLGAGQYQPITESTGNCFGTLRGSGGGASLMLFAPIDTHIDDVPKRDLPWAGRAMRADMRPSATVRDDLIIGLGAENPKGSLATLVEVATALREAGVPIVGDLIAATAGGGMPINVPYAGNHGLSSGVYHLLTRGVAPDFAIIMKPSWYVCAAEPGLCWFKLSIEGGLSYAGVPRGTPGHRNSILVAASVVEELEAWIKTYIERNSTQTIRTEGKITGIHGGRSEKAAFVPAVTEIVVDLRCSPTVKPAEVKAQFGEAVAAIAQRHPDVALDWEMIASVPAGATDPGNWIVQSCRRGWERIEGRPHGDPPPGSGETDGATIRNMGVPCARIGYERRRETIPPEYLDGVGGLGVARTADFMKSAKAIMYAAIDTLTRDRKELGL